MFIGIVYFIVYIVFCFHCCKKKDNYKMEKLFFKVQFYKQLINTYKHL